MKSNRKILALFLILTTILSSITVFYISAAQAVDEITIETENISIEQELVPAMASNCPFNADIFFDDPTLFASYTPTTLYYSLSQTYTVLPLSQGTFKGISFFDGRGYKVLWGGDKLLQYHPPGSLWHNNGNAYYKLSSGSFGTRHYDLNGNITN